jgi:hypothetical protein
MEDETRLISSSAASVLEARISPTSLSIRPLRRAGSLDSHSDLSIRISRPNGDIFIDSSNHESPNVSLDGRVRLIYGLLGIATLIQGPAAVLLTKRELVSPGFLGRHAVWRVLDVEVIPLWTSKSAVGPEANAVARDDEEYVALLRRAFHGVGLYYCTTFDLTQSQQLQNEGPDMRFAFNGALAKSLLASGAPRWAVPIVVEGFVGWSEGLCVRLPNAGNSEKGDHDHGFIRFSLALIARRDVRRTGRRFLCRGIDSSGFVANCVESEMIVADARTGAPLASHVQVRGSIPLHWRQHLSLKYRPRHEIDFHPDPSSNVPSADAAAFSLHVSDLARRYGSKITAVDLVHETGWEGELSNRFGRLVERQSDLSPSPELAGTPPTKLRRVPFDFHKNCRAMNWSRVHWLINHLSVDLDGQGYFVPSQHHGAPQAPIGKLQTGVIRTNCIDCLDRTNVVQSYIARSILGQMLAHVFACPDSSLQFLTASNADPAASLALADLESCFRALWADHGDAISTQYAGTGALKADFTRTGRRTPAGALQDAQKSMVRYLLANFVDGRVQDALDFTLGKFQPISGVVDERGMLVKGVQYHSPFAQANNLSDFELLDETVSLSSAILTTFYLRATSMPAPLLVAPSIAAGALLASLWAFFLQSRPLTSAILFAVFFAAYRMILIDGTAYVTFPCLIPPPLPSGSLGSKQWINSIRTRLSRISHIYREKSHHF